MAAVRGYYLTSMAALAGADVPPDNRCLDEADRVVDGNFTCAGTLLSYQKPTAGSGSAGGSAASTDDGWVSRDVAVPNAPEIPADEAIIPGDPTNDPDDPLAPAEQYVGEDDTVSAAGFNFDLWCEGTNKVCATRVGAYTARLKANVAYGYCRPGGACVVVGEFDFCWQQHFNGAFSSYRSRVIWDKGPGFFVDWIRAFVREKKGGTDPTHGKLSWQCPSMTILMDRFWWNGGKFYMGKYHLPSFKTVWNTDRRTYYAKYGS